MTKGTLYLAMVLGLAVGEARAMESKAVPAAAKTDTRTDTDTKGLKADAGRAAKAADTKAAKGGAEPTCGQSIAAMAHIPAKQAEGAASVAEMLEAHAAFMGKAKDAQGEVKGLRAIAKAHRQAAASLTKASEEMKKATSWPVAEHDMAKMHADPKLMAAQQKVLDAHKEIIALLQKIISDSEAHHKAMKR